MLPPPDDRLREEDAELLARDELDRARELLDRFDDEPLLLLPLLLLDRLALEPLLLPGFEREVVLRRAEVLRPELLRPELLEREDERPP